MWYAVQVKVGREDSALRQIMRAVDQAGISTVLEEAFVPKRIVFEGQLAEAKRVEQPLFPGYLILSTSKKGIRDVARVVRSVPCFTKVLSLDGVFVPLLEEEAEWVHALTKGGNRTVGVSEGFVEGGRYVVVEGPLVGREAAIKKANRRKKSALVELEFCGRSVQVELALELMRSNREKEGEAVRAKGRRSGNGEMVDGRM